tara:strand:+ start:228 stop:809 length:582 start_codon:yes stop_codon:yes gene_type:complete
MQKHIQKIHNNFSEHADVLKLMPKLYPKISQAITWIIDCYQNDHQTLWCGNGGSSSDCLHAVGELVGRFKLERQALPAITLGAELATNTAWSNDYNFADIFARGIEAHGQAGDVLIGISTSGNSANIIQAIKKAEKLNIKTIGLLGKNGGKLKKLIDLPIIVPSQDIPRIQEMHITIIHIICEELEKSLFKND